MHTGLLSIDFGIGHEQFHELYFEKRPFLKKQALNCSKFGWHTIDAALTHQDLGLELVKVLKAGRVERSEYIEEFIDIGVRRRRIIKQRLYDLVGAGATVVLNRMELVSEPVRDICMQVGRLVGAHTAANAYASIGGEPALHVHWDTHDVFAVQLVGKKRWQLFEPTFQLPISTQESNDHKRDVPKTPYLEVILEAGDVMYVPRGWWHRVEPIEETETIHLAVGVHTPLMLDYLIWACGNLLANHLEMRYSVLGKEGDLGRIEDALVSLSKTLKDPETLLSFRNRSTMRERVVTPFQIEKLVRNKNVAWSPNDIIRLNSRIVTDRCDEVYVNGKKLIFPDKVNDLETKVIKEISTNLQLSLGELRNRMQNINGLEAALRQLALADIIQVIPFAAQ